MPELIKIQDSRRTFVNTLNELAERDEKIICIIPDVGFNYLDDPKNKFLVINVGAMEQFAVVFASALALDGWKVFCYSMINFVLFRPAEQVRNAAVFHNAPVTFLGVKGGPSYKFLGVGHNLLHDKEDFNFCDNIGLAWKNPQTNEEVKRDVIKAYYSNKPCYIRL